MPLFVITFLEGGGSFRPLRSVSESTKTDGRTPMPFLFLISSYYFSPSPPPLARTHTSLAEVQKKYKQLQKGPRKEGIGFVS